MGAALPIGAIAAQALGSVVKGIGENKEARAAARTDDENGRLSLLSGEQDVSQIMRDERMMAGDALADMGGSGLAVGVGSAADILAESARQRDRDIGIRRKQAEGENSNYMQAAKDKRAAGRNALINGVFGAASSALAGANANRNARIAGGQASKERTANAGGG